MIWVAKQLIHEATFPVFFWPKLIISCIITQFEQERWQILIHSTLLMPEIIRTMEYWIWSQRRPHSLDKGFRWQGAIIWLILARFQRKLKIETVWCLILSAGTRLFWDERLDRLLTLLWRKNPVRVWLFVTQLFLSQATLGHAHRWKLSAAGYCCHGGRPFYLPRQYIPTSQSVSSNLLYGQQRKRSTFRAHLMWSCFAIEMMRWWKESCVSVFS